MDTKPKPTNMSPLAYHKVGKPTPISISADDPQEFVGKVVYVMPEPAMMAVRFFPHLRPMYGRKAIEEVLKTRGGRTVVHQGHCILIEDKN